MLLKPQAFCYEPETAQMILIVSEAGSSMADSKFYIGVTIGGHRTEKYGETKEDIATQCIWYGCA